MRILRSSLLAFSTFLVIACDGKAPEHAADPQTLRSTAQGELIGFDTGNAQAWLGVPFAQPPTGELRWQPPQRPQAWSGTHQALSYGPACPQLDRDGTTVIGEENCLTLNIFTPRLTPAEAATTKLPVMFYIHGGGMAIGGAEGVDGRVLAEENRVVFVTAQYRLGVLGWFSHPALQHAATHPAQRSGNWGTLDIVRALEWVGQNIQGFGGDPDKVMVFGQSAGGIQVYSMLTSPYAKGLFNRAIIHSGFPTTFSRQQAENRIDDPAPGEPNSSAEVLLKLLQVDGKANDREQAVIVADGMSSQAIAQYLQSKSAAQLLAPFAADKPLAGIYIQPFALRDGEVLPHKRVEQLFIDRQWNTMPVIMGTNRQELKTMVMTNSPYLYTIGPIPVGFRDQRRYDLVSEYGGIVWKALGADEQANAIAANGGDVWVYRFDWDEQPKRLWLDFSAIVGSGHGVELPFVFGSLDAAYLPNFFFDEDTLEPLSSQMRNYWTNFTDHGTPNGERTKGQPQWLKWQAGNRPDKTLVIDSEAAGGIRMTSETVTRTELIALVANDPQLQDSEERCEMYRTYIEWSELFTPEEYQTLDGGKCKDYPILRRSNFD